MNFVSTRNAACVVSAAQAVASGLAPDGGLFVPMELPQLNYKEFFELDYAARCDKVLRAFFDFDIDGVAQDAYADWSEEPAPIVKLDDDLFVLELWHGKTHAFKDMALCVLPRLLTAAKKALGDEKKSIVLVATSGDTGKAALEGFKNVEGTHCCVFYPTDGVSAVQKLTMQTQDGDNVCVAGINGNFDDAQTAVKKAMNDENLKAKLAEHGYEFSSANSINIGRLIPQIAYYYSAYCDMVESGEIEDGTAIDFVVPTGNFGNILAGWYAKKMGLPVNNLLCASNDNNVLTNFIETSIYNINREFYKTSSPSMDILISSNLERLIFEVSNRNYELTKERMESLKTTGRYELTEEEALRVRESFSCGCADGDDVDEAIDDMLEEYGYLIDPHTAVAYSVLSRNEWVRPTVVVSTANPYKFASTVLSAIGCQQKSNNPKQEFLRLEEETAMDVPQDLLELFDKPIRFDRTVDKNAVIEFILERYAK